MKQNKQTNINEPWWDFTVPTFIPNLLIQLLAKKYSVSTVLFIIIIGGFIVNQALLVKIDPNNVSQNTRSTSTVSPSPSLSAFDQDIITQLQNEGKPLLVRGSAHNHADFKVYVNGQALDFAKPEYYMKSFFMHVDDNQNKEDSSNVIHMHAKNVPLWLFFRSLGMNLTKDSLTLADGRVLKNENSNSLKFYLNGKKVDELGDYVFQPLDKLLISYGPENDPDLQKQINSITNFAKDHQK